MNITVLHHADADGFGAAYAIWSLCNIPLNNLTFIPVQYGQPVPEIPEGTHQLYIVDFSYDRETCEDLAKKYVLVILDHHKTAEAALSGLPYAHFDMSKSGCRMAWEHCWPVDTGIPDTGIPDILRYVEDRDLWKFDLAFSEEVNLYIASLPWDFEVWNDFDLDTAILAGKAIKAFRDEQLKGSLKNVRMMRFTTSLNTLAGIEDPLDQAVHYDVPVVNASTNISELGNELCKTYPWAPFSVSYCDRKDVRSWSLCSIGDFDVSDIAREFGGGGHKNAAGFSTEIGWPMMHTEGFLSAFEDAAK